MNDSGKKNKNLLARRFRNRSTLLIVFILLSMAIASMILVYNIADSASRDYVRFYTMENVDVLSAHLSGEILLVQHAAASPEIAEWFADEGNQAKKLAAYRRMMHFANMQKLQGLYFAISGSKNEYSIVKNAPFEDFVPYHVLTEESAHDRWFFDALDSRFEYILKLDTVKSLEDVYIWIDHKVRKDGEVVGVFSAGIPFDIVFTDLFGEYDTQNVLGFVIDDKGLIQMDSSMPNAESLLSSLAVYDASDMRHISDVEPNPVFISAINTYLNDHTIYYGSRVKPEVYKLSNANYQYLSVSPVPNTNWLAVTLYNSNALLNIFNFLPPIIVVLFAFVVYIMGSSVLIQKLVFDPLSLLSVSVSESEHNSDNIYGITRDDEIGALARETRESWQRLGENSAKLLATMKDRERKAQVLHAINNMATTLFGVEDDAAFAAAMPSGLKLLADCMDLDRVYIWRNYEKDGRLCYKLMYDWLHENLQCDSPVRSGKDLCYENDAPLWLEMFMRNEYVCGQVSKMKGAEADLMTSNGVKMILSIPVHLHGQFWGFVSFDNCHNEVPLSLDDIDILHSGALIISSAINRNLQTTAKKKMMDQIQHRDLLLQTVNQAASILFNSDVSKFEESLYISMRMMAKAVDADRAYIWKNNSYEGELCATQLYEWTENSTFKLNSDFTSNISYREFMPQWLENLSKGEWISGMTRNMTPVTKKFLEDTQVLSVFMSPIFLQDDFWGFVGFDDCHCERDFSDNEMGILHSGCLLMGNAFLRHSMTINLRDAAEEAKEANRSKSVFLASMSHEIRTPMNSIVGFSELALDGDNPPKTRDYLLKIIKNSEWLLQIINDILDISKIESGKMELENIQFDLHELFASCRTVIMPKAIEKGLSMHFYAEPSVGKKLHGDPTRLRQALVNLLSNAVKFTNSGMIKMQAAVKEVKAHSVTMFFEIKDSGIGITKDQLEKIFDPFVQAESGTTRMFGGSGLGLPITKNIIEMMGGELKVDSAPGVGSKFCFELTFDATDSEGEESKTERVVFDDIEKPTFEGEILLCEDNAMNQQVICEHLARIGFKTEIAQNGQIGVEMVKSKISRSAKQYDLIFMDIHMPVMDGLEAAAKIFEYDATIPIVALTANIMSNDREVYASRGMSDCIGKPFTSQVLWRCLLKYFKPVNWQKENATQREIAENELHQKMINNFVKDNNNKFDEIKSALDSNDIKLAHRLVHTLKSNAAQLNKTLLQKAAKDAEDRLKDGENKMTANQLETLEIELKAAISQLVPLVKEIERHIATELKDKDAALKIIGELEVMLENRDIESLSFINDLQSIPGSVELINQIENFDFKNAVVTLGKLKESIL